MLPELPQNYYHENVITLFEHVETLYDDILDESIRQFLFRFSHLSTDGQKLIIRLLNRSKLIFRQNKLTYPEINSIPATLKELEKAELIHLNGDIKSEDLIDLFTRTELVAANMDANLQKQAKRSDIVSALLEQPLEKLKRELASNDCIIEISDEFAQQPYHICQMIFFGNLNQSMTDFVLRDLGLNTYEKYRIDKSTRPYQSTQAIHLDWMLHQLWIELQQGDNSDISLLENVFNRIPTDIDEGESAYRRSEHLKFSIARQLERLDEQDLALHYYFQCELPPCRERVARILAKQGDYEQSLDVCESMLNFPTEDQEKQFALSFSARLIKQQSLQDRLVFSISNPPLKPQQIDLVLERQHNVEVAVVDYYQDIDSTGHCLYLENSLFNSVLGLVFWDTIFAPVKSVFFHPFQHRPSDLYEPDFLDKRQAAVTKTYDSLISIENIRQLVKKTWNSKFGLMNPFVFWNALDLDTLDMALERIPLEVWLLVFQRIFEDIRNNRSGFPDLIYFPSQGGYELIEVKGPGDQLQQNQKRWMAYFYLHKIPHLVARVSWK